MRFYWENKSLNIANCITLSRIALSFVFLLSIMVGMRWTDIVSFYVFLIAAVSDIFDGCIARITDSITSLGKFMDPLADKILVSVGLISIAGRGLIDDWPVVLIVGREMFITGIRSIAAYRGVVIQPIPIARVKTFLQMSVVFIYLLKLSYLPIYKIFMDFMWQIFRVEGELILYYLLVLTVVITLLTGIIYILRNKKVIVG
ncbi:MAG: hypothetical protein B6D57_04640 [Candidatus Coatesbacteria bacterium 4484_99]|uniref:CDP-diacylglycerol--glycerol-3-phosphate 3-phosphatidyltransferase n=1 Tax=Candidatus Coatesbacteria bacterium 4484_99 TaxID=1970774 RepID=A0A1W9RZY0_9BACT|nr:MAG: hypothetical protein B6D57_04640 [Candidatus Coatesbacteria bacterium 4484_99]